MSYTSPSAYTPSRSRIMAICRSALFLQNHTTTYNDGQKLPLRTDDSASIQQDILPARADTDLRMKFMLMN